jgi:hypothetical protein
MVKLDELPEEKERISLTELPEEMVLKAVRETWRDDVKDESGRVIKTGGLVVEFITKDGKSITQKYSKIHSKTLKEALKKLGIKDTEDLQKIWCRYKRTNFRTGFPRLIPVEKVK